MSLELTSEIDTISYALGLNVGEYFKNLPLAVNRELVLRGLRDQFDNRQQLTPEAYRDAMELCQRKMQDAGRQAAQDAARANGEASRAFLAANAAADGVQSTASGLQYRVLTAGSGPRPQAAQKVRVHYTGTLLDGTEFDSSVRRGEPAEFALNQVIAGWTEGLQLMPVGGKYRFFIPAELAYGERGAGQSIPPNSALIFDVELLAILD